MNKKITVILMLLCIISLSVAFVGCNNDAAAIVNGVDGYDAVIDNEAMTITFTVDSIVDSFTISRFNIDSGATLVAYYDESKSERVGNELALEFGENIFYLEIVGKKDSVTYKVTITREEPSDTIDPNKTVQSIEIAQAKTTYYFGEFFAPGILKVTYTDGTSTLVTFTSAMVSGFNTSVLGQVTVTVTVNDVTTTYTINVIDITVPDYAHVTPATLDAQVFNDKVKNWIVMFVSVIEGDEKYYQENYDYYYAQLGAEELSDILYDMADNLGNCGISTELFNQIDTYATAILTDVRDAIFEIKALNDDVDNYAYLVAQTILKKDRLVRVRNNAKALIDLLKPEYFATLLDGELDKIVMEVIDYDFAGSLAAAEKAGLSDIVKLMSAKANDESNASFIGLLLDYNSFAFLSETAINLIDTILDCDIDSVSAAALCIVDIASMDSEALGNLAAGKGKYSYRDIIAHVNTVGEFITSLVENVKDPAIARYCATNLMNKLFAYTGDDGVEVSSITEFFNFDVYKAVGTLLKNLTVTDITNIYMDYNDWQVAINNELSEDTCNAKFATLLVRVAKLVASALDNSGDRQGIVTSVSSVVGLMMGFVIDTDAILTIFDKAESIADPTKMSAQQAAEIYKLYESCLIFGDNDYSINYELYYYSITGDMYYSTYRNNVTSISLGAVKIDSTKTEFFNLFSNYAFTLSYYGDNGYAEMPLELTESNIIGFDASSTGYKQATLAWQNVSLRVDYIVCSSGSLSQMVLDYCETNTMSSMSFEKDSQVSIEDLRLNLSYVRYSYIDPISMHRVEFKLQDCNNLRIVGLDTSKVGEGVAYVVGEHEIFGTQVFPFNYVVNEEDTYRIFLTKSQYKVGDSVEGFLASFNNSFNSIEFDETNLDYDFSTPGYKTVTYTYNGKQYTAHVRVYSEEYAKEIDYCQIYGYEFFYEVAYLQGGDYNEFVFSYGSYINFKALDTLEFNAMTISEVRSALKAISADYDITIQGFDTTQDVGTYRAFISVTNAGRVVKSTSVTYRIIDNFIPEEIDIFTKDGNGDLTSVTDPSQIENIEIDYIGVAFYNGSVVFIKLSGMEELSKYGTLQYKTYESGNSGYWVFNDMDIRFCIG